MADNYLEYVLGKLKKPVSLTLLEDGTWEAMSGSLEANGDSLTSVLEALYEKMR